MFAKFNYIPSNYYYNSFFNPHLESGRHIYETMSAQARRCLKEFILENGHIDGDSLKEHWFNIVKSDVFLSHSHKDVEKVKGFAGWLHDTFGLTAFIDSCVWGYCDDLLKEIDNMFCWQPKSETYNYKMRNYTTTHVHTMLSSALTEMIDKCECMIFFNTPNSITLSDELEKVKGGKKVNTLSPWIYHELSVSSMIEHKKPRRVILEHRDSKFAQRSQPVVEYNIDKFLKGMTTLTDEMIVKWSGEYNSVSEPLDELYKIVYPK